MNVELVGSIIRLAATYSQVIVSAHPRLVLLLSNLEIPANVTIQAPLPYAHAIAALGQCAMLVTDSGGLIREGHLLGVPTVVRRDAGGWPSLADGRLMIRSGRGQEDLRLAMDTAWEARSAADRGPRSIGTSELLPEGGIALALRQLGALVSDLAT
jgi:UDP-N-acetylglucosamine 2-epimerase